MNLSEVLTNPHFNNLTAIIRVAFRSSTWRQNHADVPVKTLEKNFSNLVLFKPDEAVPNKVQVISAFSDLIMALTQADSRLLYTKDDYQWFIEVLDADEWWKLALMCAWYSAPDTRLTPVEIAEKTGTNESTWRNKAASGEIPGATKKGKQWLLPRSVLRSQGADV